jgi:cytidylate kinase/H/ACA ribonucleoprotein complex subunit 4
LSRGESRSRSSAKITISGPPGSGKSTVAALLAERLKVDLFSTGALFRSLAKEVGLSLEEFGRRAEGDWNIDRALDERMLQLLREKEQGIFEGRLTGYLAHRHGIPAFKVYLDAPLDVRVRRIMKREGGTCAAVQRAVEERERSEQQRYERIYGLDLQDRSYYDLVIDTSSRGPEEIVGQMIEELAKR